MSAVDPISFRRTCAKFATGITVTTVRGPDGQPHGLTVNSFTSVSCVPPLVLVCVDYDCSLLPLFRASRYFGVNVLREEQRELSVRFADKGRDRFDGLAWRETAAGVPMIQEVLGFFECEQRQTIEAGDHCVLIGEVIATEVAEGRPLLYYDSAYGRLRAGPSR